MDCTALLTYLGGAFLVFFHNALKLPLQYTFLWTLGQEQIILF
jgi:hypothetical protein